MMCQDRFVPLETSSATTLRHHVQPKNSWCEIATTRDLIVYCGVAQSVSQIRPGLISQLCFIFCTANSAQLFFPPTTMRSLLSGLPLEEQVHPCSNKIEVWNQKSNHFMHIYWAPVIGNAGHWGCRINETHPSSSASPSGSQWPHMQDPGTEFSPKYVVRVCEHQKG